MEEEGGSESFSSFLSALRSGMAGINGALGYVLIILLVAVGYLSIQSTESASKDSNGEDSKKTVFVDNKTDPPRNFTQKQLRKFNGEGDNALYISVNGTVFDVSTAREFYGPGGPYEVFAGRECGVALAKMSFDERDLDNVAGCTSLNAGEKYELDSWIDKFQNYRNYPIVGRLIPNDKLPNSDRILTVKELEENNGTGSIPDSYATAPIYLGVGDKVFDVSFGGVAFYSPGCSYHRFAGKDASRALAKMSFEQEDVDSSSTSDLTDKQLKVLADWMEKYENEKFYPIVGRLQK